MEWLTIYNWRKHQSYRQDRGAPPWIKVQRNVINHPKWAYLSDSDKGALLSIWIIAADHDGKIPGDAAICRKICSLDEEPNLNKFIDLGFLLPRCRQDGAKMASDCRQDGTPEAEAEAEADTEKPPKKPPADAGFDNWWKEYPKKVGKKPCREIWKRRRLGESPGAKALIEDIRKRKAEDRKWIEGFIPNPQTYLNQDRWEDEIEPFEISEGHGMPKSNDQKLVDWAKKRGIETRQGEEWPEFRQRIVREINRGATA